jgi:predicted acetyltransferase
MTIRKYNNKNDLAHIKRIWKECGWIDDIAEDGKYIEDFYSVGDAYVATMNGEAECAVHSSLGTIRYDTSDLKLGAVTAVTTSHIARKQGFAKKMTAELLALQADQDCAVSALGMFDQGFYDKVGFGTGSYDQFVSFDPATLQVVGPYRSPRRLTTDDFEQIHGAMRHRARYHGGVNLDEAAIMKAELNWHDEPFGLGYFDGPGGTLSHFIWGEMKGEHGPYSISWRAYQTTEQLYELLALIKSLADQVNSIKTIEFGEFQFQDLLKMPFRTRRITEQSTHANYSRSESYWQLRILNLETCINAMHCEGSKLRFNLELTDPVESFLAKSSNWTGIAGSYIINLSDKSTVEKGKADGLPTLSASVNAFSRLWFGVRSAASLAITDQLAGHPDLLSAIDHAIRIPQPHLGWDF